MLKLKSSYPDRKTQKAANGLTVLAVVTGALTKKIQFAEQMVERILIGMYQTRFMGNLSH